MEPDKVAVRYREAQNYVGWTEDDARRIVALRPLLTPRLAEVVQDFYDTIERYPQARRAITGGVEQVERLKGRLREWMEQLLGGVYDEGYAARRWRVGLRHVEIGLDQQYTIVALSRVRQRLASAVRVGWTGDPAECDAAVESLHRLLDLDLVLIECAYQYAYVQRQQRSDRLVAIGQMASGIAHELRNPLNVIRTSIFYLQHAKQATDEKRAEHMERVQRQVALADGVITALSDFARLPLPEFQAAPVSELIDETLATCSIPERIRVERRWPAERLAVRGDRRQLQVVFSNLIRNAVEAMTGAGELELSAASAGPFVEVVVRDSGAGIAADELTKIFEPFYSTKVRGIGLGLAITRAIVENHQGQLRVTSVLGEGSRFVVSLPAAPEFSLSTSSS